MSHTNPIFKVPKSRRLVSAWMLQRNSEDAYNRVKQFEDIMDQVIFMCGGVKPDGMLPTDWSVGDRKALTARFRELGVSVLNDYAGGWEAELAPITESPALVKKLVQNMVNDCEATGADGVDIDLEHLPAPARFAFTDFFAQLSQALHARNKMLSIASGATMHAYRRDWGIGFLDLPILASYADHIRPMNYDLAYPSHPYYPGPTSVAPWARERMEYMTREVPKHKIVMGLPTYSVDWDMNEPEKSRQVYDYEWIAERERESPTGRGWISWADVGIIRYTDADNHAHLLYVSDAKSTSSHLVTVDASDLAGVCFWVLLGDDPMIWECVRQHFRRW